MRASESTRFPLPRARAGVAAAALALASVAALPAVGAGAPASRPLAIPGPDAAHTIEIHVGVAGVAYIGQPLGDLVRRFPSAQVEPFAKQEDAAMVKIPESGISCYAVGDDPRDLRVASVGFNFEETYQGVSEAGYRTNKGIGKGSTVNDLLEAYGPAEIGGERSQPPALRRRSPPEDPNAPRKYQYASPDGSVKTYFVVEGARVLRVVINHLAPLDKHILKNRPKG